MFATRGGGSFPSIVLIESILLSGKFSSNTVIDVCHRCHSVI